MALDRERVIQLSPFIGGTADRSGVDLTQQTRNKGGRHRIENVVGSHKFGDTLDRHPLPTRPKHDRDARPHPQVDELLRPSTRHKTDDRLRGDRMVQYPGIHDRRLSRTVITSRDHDCEPVFSGTQLPRSIKQPKIHR